MDTRRRQELGVGVLLLGSFVLLGWMAIKVGAVGSLGPQVVVAARIADAAGIKEGAAVSIAGVDVGRVVRLGLDHDVAVAEISLDEGALVREGATLRVRARSVLGEKYLELSQGPREAPLLRDGAVLAIDRPQTEIDELVSAAGPLLDAVDAEALAGTLRVLSDALREDPERLARLLEETERLVTRGADAAEAVPGLVERLGSTLDRADAALVAVEARARQAASPLTRMDALAAELQQSASRLPGVLDEASATLVEVRGVSADARGMLADLDGIDADVRRVLANLVDLDKWELRRLLREEGILIRVRPHEVVPDLPTP